MVCLSFHLCLDVKLTLILSSFLLVELSFVSYPASLYIFFHIYQHLFFLALPPITRSTLQILFKFLYNYYKYLLYEKVMNLVQITGFLYLLGNLAS